ncbi:cell division protein ZapA [Zhaonella formicivorans]|uniref:cell division protein ZapA n=1 Tax=Zhaonella formicivorans TaxID=2528593 RepID=UPI0010E786CE|nr:cell division protein ZapA [Zhaonella formicivorans]
MQQEKDYKNRVSVNIYNSEYVVRANEPSDYIEMLAALVDRKMRQIGQRNPNMPVSKVAVLTALNLADELCKLQEDYDALVKLIEEAKRS